MDCLPLVLYLVLLLDSVLSFPPAPVIVNVSSLNFHHVLYWDPAPGTPSGTRYKINRRVNRKELKPLYSNKTSIKLKLPGHHKTYILTVQASYNQTLSPESPRYTFTPYAQTKIGPPKISVVGCGSCIEIIISLPEADQINTVYSSIQFKVFWRKPKEKALESILTSNNRYTVNNLQTGTEYCVQVWTKINVNRNTTPSAWNCTFTSIVGPSIEPYISGGVAVLLLFVIGVLMASMFCLYYTGLLCKEALPRVLLEALSRGSTLTPERTIPDDISISAEMEKQRKHNNPTAPQPATRGSNSDEEEEEEEEEGENVYMDRGAELSTGENSGQDSANVSGNSKVASSGGSGGLTEVPDTESEVEVTHGGLDHDEARAEGEEVSFMPEGPVTGKVMMEEEELKEEVCENSGNINLFSVTLAALAVCEEGEEEEEQKGRDSLTDFLKVSDLEPLLPTDSQTASDNQTAVALLLPAQEDFSVSGYEGRPAESSGYMGHR